MKKLFTIAAAILMTASVWAQAPQKMSYQAVVRDASNSLITTQAVGMQISILQGSSSGTPVYVETQTLSTNANGLVSLEIGTGTLVSGDLTTIDWANDTYFIKTETDPTGGTGYTITGTSQLMSVPYALYAKESGSSTPGPQGPAGNDGADGADGADGNDGAVGPQGPIGLTGPAGNDGVDGIDGTVGATGAAGTNGIDGAVGATGSQGIQGIAGNDGAVGPQGPIGLTGPAGNDGVDGADGNDGAVGATGSQGIQGIAGNDGAVGPQGPIGLTGPAGNDGVDGADGNDGAVGATGSQGIQGIAGNDGVDGADGNDGAVGATGTFQSGTVAGQMLYWNGTAWVTVATGNEGQVLTFTGGVPSWTGGTPPTPNVTNATTGKIWMDRNLGASQVATSSTDAASYGDLYQWGRAADGHQIRTSGTTATLSGIDQPAHGDFITINSGNYDWRSPQNDNLWQGVSGVNNPCPSGYRLPTDTELEAERASWGTNNAAGAFGSPLKLPMSGYRNYSNGSLNNVGTFGYYWSSTVSGANSRYLNLDSSDASVFTDIRAYGFSVRCIKD